MKSNNPLHPPQPNDDILQHIYPLIKKLQNLSDRELGTLFSCYLSDSAELNFVGYERVDLLGMLAFFTDINIYKENM